ncbi:MAG: aconitate hydratase AcnA [Acidobacteriota bacterium]
MSNSLDSFGVRSTLSVDGRQLAYFSLPELEKKKIGNVTRLPYSLRILLENLLRNEDGRDVRAQDIEALLEWDPARPPNRELAFKPARVILQDFTGVPAVVDFAAMRDAMAEMGGSPDLINPLVPSELVIDHSVQVDSFATQGALQANVRREFQRNRERYEFLRWGQHALANFRVVPPATGIVHQVNLEYLARVVFEGESGAGGVAYPDTLVGTDSHTTMINGLGVLGWGVGGIEAEAAMLGQPISLLIPQVVGFKLRGSLAAGATATDLVLTITQMLRRKGVVGKFVEFYGPGLIGLSLADRATLGNMSPEYGATCAISPIDAETLAYLRFTARSEERVRLVEAYAKAQGLFHTTESPEAEYSDTLVLDLESVEPSLAGPKRPQDRIPLRESKQAFERALDSLLHAPSRRLELGASTGSAPAAAVAERAPSIRLPAADPAAGQSEFELHHGSVVIAAITSCTNTSNPAVMIAAGLLAKKAVERGLQRHPGVKTSLAPGSKVVTEYLDAAGLTSYLDRLGFNLVGYGCTTCIGNSGPLPAAVAEAIEDNQLVACAVLSGNRNFEGRISPHVRANYLASPPLVVAYALAGRMDIDLAVEPLGTAPDGKPVMLRDIWPAEAEIRHTMQRSIQSDMFASKYADVFSGDEIWRNIPVPEGNLYHWDEASNYIRNPPFFEKMSARPSPLTDFHGLRVLVVLGDSVTTDHISPAGAIPLDGPAGRYLIQRGVQPPDFNSFGSRRGNHEVMMRGTFANIRLRNLLVEGVEGGYTCSPDSPGAVPIYDAAMQYQDKGIPLLVIAGKEYGSGSSRDWAAKGTRLLGVKVVLAESYERIHRSNLIGMGVLPLQFQPGESRAALGLTGLETYHVSGLASGLEPGQRLAVRAVSVDGAEKRFHVVTRVDTPNEVLYYRHGGILHYVLRSLNNGTSRFS